MDVSIGCGAGEHRVANRKPCSDPLLCRTHLRAMEEDEAAAAAVMIDADAMATVRFRAGKMTLSASRVTADPRKGWIQV